jgi:hypothetical protein
LRPGDQETTRLRRGSLIPAIKFTVPAARVTVRAIKFTDIFRRVISRSDRNRLQVLRKIGAGTSKAAGRFSKLPVIFGVICKLQ